MIHEKSVHDEGKKKKLTDVEVKWFVCLKRFWMKLLSEENIGLKHKRADGKLIPGAVECNPRSSNIFSQHFHRCDANHNMALNCVLPPTANVESLSLSLVNSGADCYAFMHSTSNCIPLKICYYI